VFSPAKNKEPFIPLFLLFFSCLVLLVRGDISYVRTCYGHKVCQITMFLSLSNNTLIMAATFELPVSSSIYLRDHKKKKVSCGNAACVREGAKYVGILLQTHMFHINKPVLSELFCGIPFT